MTKAPNATDKHVGARVRMRRMMLSMSQEKLGNALGLTFQQVQKYEKGANRIGASRLQQIGNVLQVPVAFFFEGAPGPAAPSSIVDDPVAQLVATAGGLALAQAYLQITDDERRKSLVTIAQQIASVDAPAATAPARPALRAVGG